MALLVAKAVHTMCKNTSCVACSVGTSFSDPRCEGQEVGSPNSSMSGLKHPAKLCHLDIMKPLAEKSVISMSGILNLCDLACEEC